MGFEGRQALVVDDHPDNLEVLRVVMEFNGATVISAENGAEAQALLASATPDLILLDIAMPVMNGWLLLEYIRATPRLAGCVVIAVTAHAMQGDREKALAAGFDGYISKPFQVDTLMSLILDIMERKTAHG